MLTIILYFLGFVFLTMTSLIVTILGVSIGTKKAINDLIMIYVPIYLKSLEEVQKAQKIQEDMAEIEVARNLGALSEDEANKILRNMRGE